VILIPFLLGILISTVISVGFLAYKAGNHEERLAALEEKLKDE
jgi:hypothetical protein